MQIKLDDLLRIPDSELDNVKVKLNQHDGYDDPMDLYLRSPEIINSEWIFWRTQRRFFNIGQIVINLMKLSDNEWLLTTIKRITKDLDVTNGVNYEGEELQLPGLFVLDKEMNVLHAHRAKTITDMPTAEDMLEMI